MKPEAPNFIHGHARKGKRTSTYSIWNSMKARCDNPKCKWFYRYGGRGIKVCERWKTFANFLEDMGERPAGMVLDRNNNDGHYEKSNCSWATPLENANNTVQCVLLTHAGKTQSQSAWARELGLKTGSISWRYRQGWSTERILSSTRRASALIES